MMHPAAPDLIAPRGLERGLVGTIAVSALLHAGILGLLIAVPGRFQSAPPRMQSYTVDLIAPDVIGGTNLVRGGGPRLPGPAKVDVPPAEPALPEPAAGTAAPPPLPDGAVKPVEGPEPSAMPRSSADAVPPQPAPPPPKPAAAKLVEPPHPEPKPVDSVSKGDVPKAGVQAKRPPAVPPDPPKAEAKPPTKPAPQSVGKPEVKPAKAEPKPASKSEPKSAQPGPQPKPEPKPKPESKPQAEAKPKSDAKAAPPAPSAAKPKPEAAKPSAADSRDRAIGAAVQRRAAQASQTDASGKAIDQRIAAAVQRRVEQVEKGGAGVPGRGGILGAGPGAGVGGTPTDMQYVLYEGRMRERIRNAWAWSGADHSLSVVIQFGIAADGQIVNVRTLTSSGDPTYDASAERAVRAANPLEPIPDKYRDAFSTVELTFQASDLESR